MTSNHGSDKKGESGKHIDAPSFHATNSYVTVVNDEFVLLFGRPRPMLSTTAVKVADTAEFDPVNLLYLSASAAKKLSVSLAMAVEQYEQNVGKIPGVSRAEIKKG